MMVVTTAIRASAGIRFKAKLQPIHPARLAVGESGFRLMMAEGGKAKCGIRLRQGFVATGRLTMK
jgi:hypothetical protein